MYSGSAKWRAVKNTRKTPLDERGENGVVSRPVGLSRWSDAALLGSTVLCPTQRVGPAVTYAWRLAPRVGWGDGMLDGWRPSSRAGGGGKGGRGSVASVAGPGDTHG